MNCYVTDYKEPSMELPPELNKDNTLFFPEQGMTTREQINSGRPKDFHIVTDSPFLVSLYSADNVFYWDVERKKWVNPGFQTYASSFDYILNRLFDCKSSIPRATLDGKITNVMGHGIKEDPT